MNRLYYLNRDLRNGAANGLGGNAHKPVAKRNGYREESAYGMMFFYESGYTRGELGVVSMPSRCWVSDSMAVEAGRAPVLLPWGSGGPADEYTKLGGSAKLLLSHTEVRYGAQFPKTPVFGFNDSRLLPGSATGISLTSRELSALEFQAGHFTATNGPESTNNDGDLRTNLELLPAADSIDYLGITFTGQKDSSLSLYASRLEDIWNQNYAGAKHLLTLSTGQIVNTDLNLYRTHDSGAAKGGPIANWAGSLLVGVTSGGHKVSVAYQAVYGNEPMDWASLDGTLETSVWPISCRSAISRSQTSDPGKYGMTWTW